MFLLKSPQRLLMKHTYTYTYIQREKEREELLVGEELREALREEGGGVGDEERVGWVENRSVE